MASPIESLGPTWGLVAPQRITEGITHRQLAILLKEAADDAAKLVEHNVGKLGTVSGQVKAAQLQAAIRGLQPVSTALWSGTGKITQAGMYQAGAAAADQALDLDLLLGMPGKGIIQYANLIHFDAAQSVEDIISRRTEGFALSQKIYANGKLTVRQVGRIVEKNLALQRSAREIAQQVRSHFHPNVPGGTSYAAMRLARTEINNAHHTTTKRLGKAKPWVLAMKWNLSRSHPKPDPCDAYAAHNEGLGAGVYEDPPSKPHPQCLCYLTHVTESEEEFINKLANGQYDNWLEDKGVTC